MPDHFSLSKPTNSVPKPLRSRLSALSLSRRLLVVGAILLAAMPTQAAPDPTKILHIALEATDEGFDPARSVNYYSGVVLEAIGESLLTYDYLARPARLVPGVAEDMPKFSDGGRTLTLKIRQGVFFHPDPAFKGQKRELTAADFVFSIKRFLDPKLRSQWRFLFDGKIDGLDAIAKAAEKSGKFDYAAPVAGLEAPDRYTLRIRLTRADFNFPYILAMPSTMALAHEVVAAYPDDLGAHPIGTNAYQLKEYRHGSRIVLEANPDYRGFKWNFSTSNATEDQKIVADMQGKDMPQIGRVEISFIEEEQSRYLAFLRNQLDLVAGVGGLAESWRDGNSLKPDLLARGIRRQDSIQPELTYTHLNFRDPVIGGTSREKVALRRAIIMAYDQQAEITTIRKNMALTNTMPIPRGVVGYNPDYRPTNNYNPAAANKLLDRFAYRRGADGWRTLPDGQPLILTLTSEPQQISREFDELWRKSLEKIGIRLTVKKGTFGENLKAAKECQLQLWGSAWAADFPDGENFLQLLYGPNAGQANNGCYDSPVFNKLYEMSLNYPDSPERNKLYELMSRQMEYDGAWRIGVSRIRSTLLHSHVQGYKKHPVMHAEWKFMDLAPAAAK